MVKFQSFMDLNYLHSSSFYYLQQARTLSIHKNIPKHNRNHNDLSPPNYVSAKIETTQPKSTRTVASTITLMTASFYICWTPYAIRCIIELLGYPLPSVVFPLTVLFAKFGVVINPVLYIFYNKEVNQD